MTRAYISAPTIKMYKVDGKIFTSIGQTAQYIGVRPTFARNCIRRRTECNGKRIIEMLIDRETLNEITIQKRITLT